MHFSAVSAVGLGLLAAHATAIALPDVPLVNSVPSSLRVDYLATVTIVTTALPVTVTVTATVTASANSTVSTNSTISIKTSAIPSTALPTSTTPSTPGLTADQQRALDLHNIARAEVGNGNLVWDAELAKSAQKWANYLTTKRALEHDSNTGGQGENLASMSGGPSTYYAYAVELWLKEKALYDNKPITDKGSPNYHDYGHYTQCIWKGTQRVGLALAVDENGTVFVVARYFPAGNYIGQMPF
ncbi:putative SCP-like extracellular protein [Colletotrichum sublineola]|uniref:Putative SCP-like extracellular protein n=1 Tax=Colletotrichum sublineola TaxID=1173701 RepID=A0A066X8U2_COLSU|nr:putative SCP-like extracellular protein [Colletotrichum sublineola]